MSENAKGSFKSAMLLLLVGIMIGAFAGFYIGGNYYAKTKVEKIEVPSTHLDATMLAKITAGYVKAEMAQFPVFGAKPSGYSTTHSSVVNETGGTSSCVVTVPNVPTTQQQANMKLDFSFDQFNVLANGRPISFKKDVNEKFMFQNNMLNWTIGVNVTADIKPPDIPLRPSAGPYFTTKSVGGVMVIPKKAFVDVFTVTTPWRDRMSNKEISTFDIVEFGYGRTWRF